MNYVLFLLALFTFGIGFSQEKTDTIQVYFELNSSDISQSMEDEIWEFLFSNNSLSAVHAHSDTLGTFAYNDALAKRRLDAVLDILKRNENLELNEEFNTQVFGEREAVRSIDYRAAEFRRVDVIFSNLEPIENVPVEIEAELPPEQKAVVTLTNSFVEFLQDSAQTESLIQLNVLFFGGSVQYLPESEPELQALFDFMKYNANVKAHIRGHICCAGKMDWDDVSDGRAKTVYVYLLQRGISHERMTYRGYGTSIPFRSPEITQEDQKLNRRVDIIFTKMK